MKVDRLHIKQFKNLKDVTIDFDKSSLVNILLGWNGTGKSNIIESLVIIFRNIDLNEAPSFYFTIEYECKGKKIKIVGDPELSGSKKYQAFVKDKDWTEIKIGELRESHHLPDHVFAYYSGPSDRLSEHFKAHQNKFYRSLLDNDDKPLRPFFYARTIHSQFVLLSFFISEDKRVKDFLEKFLGIVELESILFVLNKPTWSSRGGDERFWNARGVVKGFLSNLMKVSTAPIRVERQIDVGFRKRERKEFLYMFLKDQNSLVELRDLCVGENKGKTESSREFFKLLESTYISELLDQVRIRVKIKNTDDSLTFRELSEGEQQLLTVLGLLRFTSSNESLFLLDEPDTHINPSWSVDYIEHLKTIGGLDEYLDKKNQSHIIMATHNPMVLAGLSKDQVHILRRNEVDGRIFSEIPTEDPKGLGVTGILTSEMFGLSSDLDRETQALVDEHARLLSKEKLSKPESKRLDELNEKLTQLGFVNSHSNPYYNLFLKAWAGKQSEIKFDAKTLSKKDKEDLTKIADQIFDEIDEKNK